MLIIILTNYVIGLVELGFRCELFFIPGSLDSSVLFLQLVAISDFSGHLPICCEQVSSVKISTAQQINDSRSGGNVFLKTCQIFCLF